MGMNRSHGGHLTHGSPVSISGKWFNVVAYGVREDSHLIDYEEVERMALREKPKLLIAGASAYARMIDFVRFRAIADKAGAYFMVDIAHIAGLVAAGLHPSPVPHAHVVTSTTHQTLRGMDEHDMKAVGRAIAGVLKSKGSAEAIAQARQRNASPIGVFRWGLRVRLRYVRCTSS